MNDLIFHLSLILLNSFFAILTQKRKLYKFSLLSAFGVGVSTVAALIALKKII